MNPPEIRTLQPKLLVGMRIQTSIAENKAKELWQGFKPRVKEIANTVPNIFYSIQVMPKRFDYRTFTSLTKFDKWAAIEVSAEKEPPHGMETLFLEGGLHAVFIHKGPATAFRKTFQFIHDTWLPNSKYELDDRPHFEILDEHYLGPMNPDSEEEVWIPMRNEQPQ